MKRLGMLVVALIALFAFSAVAEAGSYNGYAARDYALQYAINPNPAYRYFDLDCTNFVSQALLAGGWTETGKYNYASNYAWYYDWGTRPGYSNTWTVANNLYYFLSYSYRAYPVGLAHKPWYNYFSVGDIVQIDYTKDGSWDHSMIVTAISVNDMYMTYHTSNTKDKSLNQIMAEYPNAGFLGWHIKSTY